MDAFFASIEQRDNHSLKGKPIAVGGGKKRGVVAAASYEARIYGVKSAMPSFLAFKKCQSLIFVKPRFSVYKSESEKIMKIFKNYTDLVEPMSLDEAYLDVSEICKRDNITAYSIATRIKNNIKEKLDLTASAGVSINKFLAKVASDYNKPDGLFVIQPKDVDLFIDELDINKIPGIGKKTYLKMNTLGIKYGKDIKSRDRRYLERAFGKMGGYFHDLLHLKVNNPVITTRIRKSIGTERTFNEDITSPTILIDKIDHIVLHLVDQLERQNISGRTITLKIKFSDFQQVTRSRSFDHYISNYSSLLKIAKDLLFIPIAPKKPIRLIGISISNLNINEGSKKGNQLELEL